MKIAITTGLALLLAAFTGSAFAGPMHSSSPQDRRIPPSMSQQQTSPQGTCTNQYPTFSQLDTKNQGYITKKEASQVPQLKKDFKKVNTEHNGKLTEAEYTSWVQTQCNSAQTPNPPPVG